MEDRKTVKKINDLIKDILRNGPIKGIGKPEPLKFMVVIQKV
jgi:toxin YoeB